MSDLWMARLFPRGLLPLALLAGYFEGFAIASYAVWWNGSGVATALEGPEPTGRM